MDNLIKNEDEKIGYLNILILILSVYVLGSLLASTFFHLPVETVRLLDFIDNIICAFFFYDFSYRFAKAKNKLHFMKWGWIDLISSIPTISIFRTARLIRIIRLLRILRAFKSTKHIINHVFRNRAQGTFTTVSIIAVLMLLFAAIAILQVETDANSNIKSAEDALWWAISTITTVGYGDRFPVTTEGRIIGAILMITGVGLFGTFSGFIASWFLEGIKNENKQE